MFYFSKFSPLTSNKSSSSQYFQFWKLSFLVFTCTLPSQILSFQLHTPVNQHFIAPSYHVSSTNTITSKMNEYQEKRWFNNHASKRISALFSSSQSLNNNENDTKNSQSQNDYSTKNRSRELKRLAQTLEVDVGKVKEMLNRQLPKLNANSEKANYVNWLLRDDDNGKGNDDKKRKRSDSKNLSNGNDKKGHNNSNDEKKNTTTKSRAKTSIDGSNVRNGKKEVQPKKPTKEQNQDSMKSTSTPNSNLHSEMRFQELDLNKFTKKAISNILKHEFMTEIQSRTYAAAASGTDVLGRARTGTGKTLAFLIPALERILKQPHQYSNGKNIGILVISPTRELATQIGDQAEKLLTYHKGLSCQVMYGGTKMTRDVNVLNKRLPTILVATPGRLLDHLENTKLSNGKKFGYDIMRETPLLILDEADRLLDMGFQREIQKIMKYLPRQDRRQTLLFSATVPQELKQIMSENMREDYVEVDCIGGDGNSEFANEEHTNILVKQTHVILPSLDSYVTSVVQIMKHFMKEDDHKLVVFFPTARAVGYFAEFFRLGLGIDVIEIHSRKSQGYRNSASEKFRNAKSGILFTSDVSARGVDYPDVSGVIQIGLPESRDQYIHRLGRTGRAGKDGTGLLVLAPFEGKFLSELKDLDIPLNRKISEELINPIDGKTTNDLNNVFNRIRSGDATLTLSAQQAYAAFIGYYRGNMKRTSIRNNEELVDIANKYSSFMGLKEIPGLTKRAASKMGLQKVSNIRLIDESELRGKGRGKKGGNRMGRRTKP